eukprot:Nitzschia sp. Nitz4//scaffold22_size323478//125838//127525//NITZ4_000525-RA/size323478-augustus-gene-0.233-mRNA-1//-1//CDS//3329542989//1629//frame0
MSGSLLLRHERATTILSTTRTGSNTTTMASQFVETAVPTLKVMRLQKPELHMPTAGTMETTSLLGSAMCLPDSFGVIHIGETFTAYLGALNVSPNLTVSRLTVNAQLQTPTQRWHLASRLDEGNASGGVTVPPESAVDAIVSHLLDEVGQHILRVEVGYAGGDGTPLTLRKFYRFSVSNPLSMSTEVFRTDDSSCMASVLVTNTSSPGRSGGLCIVAAELETKDGFAAEPIDLTQDPSPATAACMYDQSGRLEPGEAMRYLFRIYTTSDQGMAAGDVLGQAVLTWRKSCGELGRRPTAEIVVPSLGLQLNTNDPVGLMEGSNHSFVTHLKGKSPLSVDVAAAAAGSGANLPTETNALDRSLPITVEPIHPPSRVNVGEPFSLELLVINHSERERSLQLQFLSEHMAGVSICGSSFKNLPIVEGQGGSTVVSMRFLPLVGGLVKLGGCNLIDMNEGVSIPQPPICQVLVESGV